MITSESFHILKFSFEMSTAESALLTRLFCLQIAYNCWIAAAIYLVTLVISMQQFHVNKQAGHFQL